MSLSLSEIFLGVKMDNLSASILVMILNRKFATTKDSGRSNSVPPGVGIEDEGSSCYDDSGSEDSFVQDSFNDDGDKSLSGKDVWIKSRGAAEVKTRIGETSVVVPISYDSIEVGGSELGIYMENEVKSKLLKVSSCGPKFVKKSLGLSMSEPLVRVNRLVGHSFAKAHSLGSVQNQAEIAKSIKDLGVVGVRDKEMFVEAVRIMEEMGGVGKKVQGAKMKKIQRLFYLSTLGGGSLAMKTILNQIIRKGKADIVFLQETKIQVMNDLSAQSLWGDKEIKWETMGSIGKCGGIIIIWRNQFLNPLYSFSGTGFVGLAATINNIIDLKIQMCNNIIDLKRKFRGNCW
ncbi:hypothetical protein KIW84_064896 [Lathyrus oleraceus]|uniref:Uncharacterized protein n=1 Tax=Pisum sativum TaxID=3888 RepID=A0A9D4WCU7_PEA|nr:hypothetical protein KIW84_064896 [Pisum sativum]